MQVAMIGLGRMGANMVRRLMQSHHDCVVYDRNPKSVQELVADGARGADSLEHMVFSLHKPRTLWLMLPAAVVDQTISELSSLLSAGDSIIDGGNSFYQDDIHRAERLQTQGIHYLDVGTSGGVWGLEHGYCLMIGSNDAAALKRLEPIFAALAPGKKGPLPQGARENPSQSTAESGYLHCGPAGAGHFVKMVHNGIEYGVMAAFAEGFNILHGANIGKRPHPNDAETTPLRNPAYYQYDFDLAEIAELWRHGSVIRSWLLDLLAAALKKSPRLEEFHGAVSDSGEGRWTVHAAIDEGIPAPILSAALFERFSSRGEAVFSGQVLSALRHAFGGHSERSSHGRGES